MKKTLLHFTLILFLLSSICVFSQTERIKPETIFMDCMFASLPDGGAEFEGILVEAEALLIRRELLKDNSGESYVDLYKNLKGKSRRKFEDLGVKNYFYKIILSQQIDTLNPTCEEGSKKVSKEIKEKMRIFNELTMDIKENIDNHDEVIAKVLTLMKPEDFELDYYKFMTYLMLETYHTMQLGNADIIESSSEYITEETTKDLKIEIKFEEIYLVENNKFTLDELLQKVKKHLQKYKSESSISFKVDGKTVVSTIMNLKEEIKKIKTTLRNELALEKYKLPFEKLLSAQQEEVMKIYPEKF